MQTLRAFVNGNRISATCELIEKRPDALMSDMPTGSRHWRVTLRAERRRLTIYFSQGPAIEHAPTAEDVLDCLANDAAGYDNARSFEEWCNEYGYDTDSRRAEQIAGLPAA